MASASRLSFVEGRFACDPTAIPHTQENKISDVTNQLSTISDDMDRKAISHDTWDLYEIRYVGDKMKEYDNTPRGELKAAYEKSKTLFSSMETRLGPFVTHSYTQILLKIASNFVFFIPALIAISLISYVILVIFLRKFAHTQNWRNTWKGIFKCSAFLGCLFFLKAHLQIR